MASLPIAVEGSSSSAFYARSTPGGGPVVVFCTSILLRERAMSLRVKANHETSKTEARRHVISALVWLLGNNQYLIKRDLRSATFKEREYKYIKSGASVAIIQY
ncbi:uncharacterized protein LAESUDRAFT_532962 [Laetiporus sulphureus 93-53]|uniref:Uncharacterized protein n=1 Tax=Laetiporus sulphureus 93-53 TaxID=1314785 RepID=A0A165BBH1_9APHY|nr:uncharacterized protein LAESUDRAFT_532962 [Laetiporus sulphureus 93-53]KZT00676.1 hypothetical protein LAESUDRAFT_532962 [Laetiporus sulphureus 93-53]